MDRLEAFARDLALQGKSKSYRDVVLWEVQRYLARAGPTPESKDTLLKYLGDLRAQDLRQQTIRRIFSNLSVYFSYLVEAGELAANPVPPIQKRYIRSYKDEVRQRQLISIENARKLIRTTIDTRDQAILLLFLKTGIRRGELISLDVDDVDLKEKEIVLKPTAKRTNRTVSFDDEARRALQRWLKARETRYKKS
ncbi:MAG: tyrosine-type recombinase/integrase, partial [Methanotrichaceae archaeon]|nr:tyrosine-type recombinase/integrase [Methanotrichaceae archaeon]